MVKYKIHQCKSHFYHPLFFHLRWEWLSHRIASGGRKVPGTPEDDVARRRRRRRGRPIGTAVSVPLTLSRTRCQLERKLSQLVHLLSPDFPHPLIDNQLICDYDPSSTHIQRGQSPISFIQRWWLILREIKT